MVQYDLTGRQEVVSGVNCSFLFSLQELLSFPLHIYLSACCKLLAVEAALLSIENFIVGDKFKTQKNVT